VLWYYHKIDGNRCPSHLVVQKGHFRSSSLSNLGWDQRWNQERLQSLMLMSVESDIIEGPDIEKLVQHFVDISPRRWI
jgi:hypothetical protein